jgi:hypothetical protein
MGWIEDHLKRRAHVAEAKPRGEDQDTFSQAARRRWQQLGDELRADVAEFNSHRSGADFIPVSESQYRVRNSAVGLELLLTADFDAHTVEYSYSTTQKRSAGTPEGGILSMRESRRGTVEFYSSDERLTPEEARQVLLQPLLFPPELAA